MARGVRSRGPVNPGSQLYFMHIPKTGGTSLSAYLGSQFRPEESCPPSSLSALLSMPRGSLARYRLICGHYGMYLLKVLDPAPCVVTLLRDPLSRSVSHYRDICARPAHPLHAQVRRQTFEEFVASEIGESELLNLQCRFLSLDDPEADFRAHERLRADDMAALRAKYTHPAMLERARAAIASMSVVGLSERALAAAAAIARTMSLAQPARLPRLNASVIPFRAESLTPEAVRRVRELTEFDQELYDLVAREHGGTDPRGPEPPAIPSQIPS